MNLLVWLLQIGDGRMTESFARFGNTAAVVTGRSGYEDGCQEVIGKFVGLIRSGKSAN